MTAQVVLFVLQIAGMMVLARLLTPADYGLIGMVTVVVNFAQMFKDVGLSMATVQKEQISHEQISTLFWINVLISAVLGVCVLVGSPLVAAFYGKPELTAVTAVLSISFIISGLSIQHAALLRRHMRFGNLAIVQIAAQVITLAVTILLAFYGWRYWALVGGSLTTAFASVVLTFFFCPWLPGRMQRGTGVRDMLKFGGYVTGSNMVNYLSGNMDNILIGKFIGADALGLYAKAYQLFMLPITQISGPLLQVAMPVLSSLKQQPERYIKYYQRIIDILSTLTMPLALYCVIEAEFLIRLVLGTQWLGAVPVFRVLAIAGIIRPVASTWGIVTLSCGFSDRYFYWGVIHCLVTLTAIVIGLSFGIKGVAAAFAIANYVIFIPCLFFCFHKTPITVALFLKTLFWPFLTSALAGCIIFLIRQKFMSDSFGDHFLCAGLFVVICIGLSFCRCSVRQTLRLLIKGIPVIKTS